MLFDTDLALLYGVETKALKRAVRRNIERFPEDFMFELTPEEHASLRSQNGTLKRGEHTKYRPFAFTEQGVAMLSGILKSPRAIETNIAIMRTFAALRRWMQSNKELAAKIRQLESRYDEQFKVIFDAIRELIRQEVDVQPMRPIGFKITQKSKRK